MLLAIGLILAGFYWLLIETDWLRVRLLVGAAKRKYARYAVYNMLKPHKVKGSDVVIHAGAILPDEKSTVAPDTIPTYNIILSPGVTEPLCGYAWLDKHCADLTDYEPRIQLELGRVRYDMHVKAPEILREVMKVNKLSKADRLAAC